MRELQVLFTDTSGRPDEVEDTQPSSPSTTIR